MWQEIILCHATDIEKNNSGGLALTVNCHCRSAALDTHEAQNSWAELPKDTKAHTLRAFSHSVR